MRHIEAKHVVAACMDSIFTKLSEESKIRDGLSMGESVGFLINVMCNLIINMGCLLLKSDSIDELVPHYIASMENCIMLALKDFRKEHNINAPTEDLQ